MLGVNVSNHQHFECVNVLVTSSTKWAFDCVLSRLITEPHDNCSVCAADAYMKQTTCVYRLDSSIDCGQRNLNGKFYKTQHMPVPAFVLQQSCFIQSCTCNKARTSVKFIPDGSFDTTIH